MMKSIPFEDLLNKAERYCLKGEKCEFDIRNFLYKKGASYAQIEKTISLFKKDNLVNDLRYANLFVMEKFKLNKWGRLKIRFKLKQKKINNSFIIQSINQIQEDEYILVLKQLIDLKKKMLHLESKSNLRTKLIQYAYSRGFEKNLIVENL